MVGHRRQAGKPARYFCPRTLHARPCAVEPKEMGVAVSPLRCPLCHVPLAVHERGARCSGGHTFDRARTGYLNLLPVQHKHSRHPGDDPAMVDARSEFLASGAYVPLRDALTGLLARLKPAQLLDCGCGEGWYTVSLSRVAASTTALDISKAAIGRAARRASAITWLVASSADLPLLDGSVDAITAIFSPVRAAEAARVLRPDGRLFVVAPDQHHLQELRAALYDDVRLHRPLKWLDDVAPRFHLRSSHRLRFGIHLPSNRAVQALLAMTPYVWRTARARWERVATLPHLSVQADFRIFHFQRSAP